MSNQWGPSHIAAICGACGAAGYVERALDAMLETLSDHGPHSGRWTRNTIGLGRRAAPAARGECAEPAFAVDANTGLVTAAEPYLAPAATPSAQHCNRTSARTTGCKNSG